MHPVIIAVILASTFNPSQIGTQERIVDVVPALQPFAPGPILAYPRLTLGMEIRTAADVINSLLSNNGVNEIKADGSDFNDVTIVWTWQSTTGQIADETEVAKLTMRIFAGKIATLHLEHIKDGESAVSRESKYKGSIDFLKLKK